MNRSNAKGKSILSIFDILRGIEKIKYDSKYLYDHRICYYEESTNLMRPVNRIAEIAIFASAELPNIANGMLANSYLGAVFEAHVVQAVLRNEGQ